jgi:hypothetical protein
LRRIEYAKDAAATKRVPAASNDVSSRTAPTGDSGSGDSAIIHVSQVSLERFRAAVSAGVRNVAATLIIVGALAFVAFGQSTAPADATAPVTAQTAPASAATPTLDQILARYERAIGGRAAWQKLTSRTMLGTIEGAAKDFSGTVLIQKEAPNKIHSAVIINGAAYQQGYDGIAGWTDDPKDGMRDRTGAELAEAKRDADFLYAFDLRKLYSKLTVTGTEKVGDGDAYVIEAAVPEGGAPTKMYFDTQTGLLVRVESENHDADGVSHLREDLSDYRVVDGVKLPFSSKETNGDTTYTITMSEVHHNVDLEDSSFAKPAVQ